MNLINEMEIEIEILKIENMRLIKIINRMGKFCDSVSDGINELRYNDIDGREFEKNYLTNILIVYIIII